MPSQKVTKAVEKREPRPHRSSVLRPWLVPALLWAAPALAFALLVPLAFAGELASVAPARLPADTVVGERVRDLRLDVVASVDRGPLRNIVSPMQGTVTAVADLTGSIVPLGATLVTINGTQVLAEVGGSPLYRELKVGDRGPDVVTLHEILKARGFTVTVGSSTFDRQTAAAVKALRASIGAEPGNTFGPQYLAYVPANEIVESSKLSVGDVVAPGDALFELAQRITNVALKAADGASGTLAQFGTEPVELSLGDAKLSLSSVQLSDDDRAALSAFIRDRLSDGRLAIDDDGKAAGLTLALANTVRVGTLPTTAIYAASNGTLCVFASEEKAGYSAIVLRQIIPSTEIAVAYLDASLVGKHVRLRVSDLDPKFLDQCG